MCSSTQCTAANQEPADSGQSATAVLERGFEGAIGDAGLVERTFEAPGGQRIQSRRDRLDQRLVALARRDVRRRGHHAADQTRRVDAT